MKAQAKMIGQRKKWTRSNYWSRVANFGMYLNCPKLDEYILTYKWLQYRTELQKLLLANSYWSILYIPKITIITILAFQIPASNSSYPEFSSQHDDLWGEEIGHHFFLISWMIFATSCSTPCDSHETLKMTALQVWMLYAGHILVQECATKTFAPDFNIHAIDLVIHQDSKRVLCHSRTNENVSQPNISCRITYYIFILAAVLFSTLTEMSIKTRMHSTFTFSCLFIRANLANTPSVIV